MTAPAPPLALLAHELRTPLNAIIGYAEAMTLGVFGPVNAPYGEHAATIQGAARHLLALVEDMAASAGPGVWAGHAERFDPSAQALEVVAWLAPRASAAGVAINTDMAGGAGEAMTDRRAFRQILVNLLDNALKFTGVGGRVTLRLAWDGDELWIVVADSGPGALSTPPSGSGIGLGLVSALCAALGGALSVETSPPGTPGGRTARVRLPAAAPVAVET